MKMIDVKCSSNGRSSVSAQGIVMESSRALENARVECECNGTG
jgi:hypothetical protein